MQGKSFKTLQLEKTVLQPRSKYHGTVIKIKREIDQFRIPGRTGESFVKPTKVRLMGGRNELTRAVAMANHQCFAFNCK